MDYYWVFFQEDAMAMEIGLKPKNFVKVPVHMELEVYQVQEDQKDQDLKGLLSIFAICREI